MVFRSSPSNADLLTVSDLLSVSTQSTADIPTVFDRIARAFNRSGPNRAVALDMSKFFDKVTHAVFFKNLSLMEVLVSYLELFYIFVIMNGFEWFWIRSLQKNIQLILEFFKTPV